MVEKENDEKKGKYKGNYFFTVCLSSDHFIDMDTKNWI